MQCFRKVVAYRQKIQFAKMEQDQSKNFHSHLKEKYLPISIKCEVLSEEEDESDFSGYEEMYSEIESWNVSDNEMLEPQISAPSNTLDMCTSVHTTVSPDIKPQIFSLSQKDTILEKKKRVIVSDDDTLIKRHTQESQGKVKCFKTLDNEIEELLDTNGKKDKKSNTLVWSATRKTECVGKTVVDRFIDMEFRHHGIRRIYTSAAAEINVNECIGKCLLPMCQRPMFNPYIRIPRCDEHSARLQCENKGEYHNRNMPEKNDMPSSSTFPVALFKNNCHPSEKAETNTVFIECIRRVEYQNSAATSDAKNMLTGEVTKQLMRRQSKHLIAGKIQMKKRKKCFRKRSNYHVQKHINTKKKSPIALPQPTRIQNNPSDDSEIDVVSIDKKHHCAFDMNNINDVKTLISMEHSYCRSVKVIDQIEKRNPKQNLTSPGKKKLTVCQFLTRVTIEKAVQKTETCSRGSCGREHNTRERARRFQLSTLFGALDFSCTELWGIIKSKKCILDNATLLIQKMKKQMADLSTEKRALEEQNIKLLEIKQQLEHQLREPVTMVLTGRRKNKYLNLR